MSVSIEKLTELLTESDLSKADQLRDALARLGLPLPDLAAECVVAELMKSGVITPLQSELLLAGHSLIIGHYVLCEKIGEGGMGTVFAARHRHMGRMVAVKVIRSDRFRDPGSIERFRREIQLAARLRHTNIVVAFDAGEDHGSLYLVMELVEGCDLARHVRRHGVLGVPAALDAVRQTACGLAYLHSQKLVHRDIKPSNLLLDRQGTVKILDLGLSRLVEWSEATQTGVYCAVTASGEPMGSVDFMSPEQFVNARLVDARADLYSLGCTLYSLLAGRPPFRGASVGERIIAHREHPIPSLREVVPDAPAELDRLFQKLLAKDPSERPKDARSVISEIDALGLLPARQSDTPAAVAYDDLAETEALPPAQSVAGRRMRKRKLAAWACAVAGIVVALFFGSRNRPAPVNDTASVSPAGPLVSTSLGTKAAPPMRSPQEPTIAATVAPNDAEIEEKTELAAVSLPDPLTRRAVDSDDKDHLAALWAFKLGGEVHVQTANGFFSARSPGDLPTAPFRLLRLNVSGLSLADTDCSLLAALPNLETVDFGRSDADDRTLGALARATTLTNLSLMGTKIGDDGIKQLDDLARLSSVDLRGTSVTDAGIAHFAERHSVDELRLGEGQAVGDAGAESLVAMRSLKSLGLRHTYITDKAVFALAVLEKLEWLDLGGCNNLTDESIAALAQYKSLKRVLLDGVRVSPDRISELERDQPVRVDR